MRDSTFRPVQRVQLFFPPMVFSKLQSRQTAMFPMGLGYIAAVLEREDYDVSLVDCACRGYETLIDLGEDRFFGQVVGGFGEDLASRGDDQAVPVAMPCGFGVLRHGPIGADHIEGYGHEKWTFGD